MNVMVIEIKVWQITNDKLEPIEATMTEYGRKEREDLEKWIKSNPEILGDDIIITGEQVPTKSGSIDFLGIDRLSGDLVVIELKRDVLPREALAQAIDYASCISSWDIDKVSEECNRYTKQSLEDYLHEKGVETENITINEKQRILLVGFSIDEALQRMVEWLSSEYGVFINVVILKYIRTKSNEELLARTVVIPEEIARDRSKGNNLVFIMSDEPGNYDEDKLRSLLKEYLSKNGQTPRRIREILLPLCLEHETVSRDMIIEKLLNKGEAESKGKAGTIVTTISREIGLIDKDYLRQIIRYDKSNSEKDNYRLESKYKDLVKEVLRDLQT
jgi:hypothetical protein